MMYQPSPIVRLLIAERRRKRRQAILNRIFAIFYGVALAMTAWAGSWILYGLTH